MLSKSGLNAAFNPKFYENTEDRWVKLRTNEKKKKRKSNDFELSVRTWRSVRWMDAHRKFRTKAKGQMILGFRRCVGLELEGRLAGGWIGFIRLHRWLPLYSICILILFFLPPLFTL